MIHSFPEEQGSMDADFILSDQERALLSERIQRLPAIIHDMPEMLGELAELIGIQPREEIIARPEGLVERIDTFLKNQDFGKYDERSLIWLLTRIGYFVAQVLILRYGGRWAVEERHESPFFLRYVITGFTSPRVSGTAVDPFQLANDLSHPGNPGLAEAFNKVYLQLDVNVT